MVKKTILLFLIGMLASCGWWHTQRSAKVYFNAANYLNPDVAGKAAPVVITVYQLKYPNRFRQATYSQLADNAANLLGSNLIDKQTFEIRPRQHNNITLNLTDETRYLGFIADYRNINSAEWRTIIETPKKTKHVKLDINLESQAISVKKR